MIVRPRFTIRTLLIAVAVPAVLLGLHSEWMEARERDFYADQHRVFLELAEEMDRISSDCRARAWGGAFDPADPTWVGLDRRWNLVKQGVPDWGVAVGWFSDGAAGLRRTAGKHAELKQQHQGRLFLLP